MIDRRQRRRIITLKNFAALILVAVVTLVAMNIASEARAPRGREYGRIVGRRIEQVQVSTRAPDVVTEAPVDEAYAGPPPQALDETATLQPAVRAAQVEPAATRTASAAPKSDARVIAISGDETGVNVTSQHKLRGGIFRPQ